MVDDAPLAIGAFNRLPSHRIATLMTSCCAAPTWVRQVAAGRPYGNQAALLASSDTAFTTLNEFDVAQALADHPRIGDKPSESSTSGHFSSAEQASVGGADEQIQRALQEGNRAYEERFDRVFLIRAAGRTPEEILGELRRRMNNDDQTELSEVIEQLRQITYRRLEALVQ